MKRLITIIALLALAASARAQDAFPLHAQRLEFGVNVGQAGSFSPYARFAMGANLLVNGIYVDFLGADPQHKYARTSDTKWDDHVAFCINAGWQIPILKWLRVMPVIGYAQTNDGITDASVTYWDVDDTSSRTYHPYKVTPGSRSHYFNYGGGLSIQPCKWFSINLIGTAHAIYGGVGIDLITVIRNQ